MKKVVGFVLSLILAVHGAFYDCFRGNVSINFNEIAFYQVSIYPMVADIQLLFCDLTISLNETDFNNDFRIFSYLMEIADIDHDDGSYEIYNDDDFVIFSSLSTFSPEFPYFKKSADAVTQLGYIIFEDDLMSCPMEGLCKEKPFELKDETEIIQLTNNINYDKKENIYGYAASCNWKFSAPNGYGFKFSVENIDSSFGAVKFVVRNSTQVIFNERSLASMNLRNLIHPIYNSDNYIEISFHIDSVNETFNLPAASDVPFIAKLSIVKNNPKILKLPCSVYADDDDPVKFWWEIDLDLGYPNNAYCKHDFSLPPNHLLHIETAGQLLERNADIIKFYLNDENGIDIYSNGRPYLDSGPFNKTQNYTLEFKSDGSIPDAGFSLEINVVECKCNAPIIPCNTPTAYFYMAQTETYCNNLQCNFTFEKCPTEYSLFTYFTTSTIFQVFNIQSNNETIYDIKNYNEYQPQSWTIVKTSADNFLKILPLAFDNYVHEKDFLGGSQRRLEFNLYSYSIPKTDLNITLSLNTHTILLDLGLYRTVNFEISKELQDRNTTTTIYVSDLIYEDNNFHMQIFNNESLTYNLVKNTCFDDVNPYFCKLKLPSFTVAQRNYPKTYVPFLAAQLSEKDDGCVFDKTIFILTQYGLNPITNFNISQLAKPSQSCIITLIVDLSYDDSCYNNNRFFISTLWTTSIEENVKMYFGGNQSKMLLEFNQATAPTWKYITLNSKAYTIEIPKAASLLITIERYDRYVPDANFPSTPFRSLLASPFFAARKNEYGDHGHSHYYFGGFSGNRAVTFTVLYYKYSPDEQFYFWIDETEKIMVNEVGDVISFQRNSKNRLSNVKSFNQEVKLIYYNPNNSLLPNYERIDNGIFFQVQYGPAVES